MKRPFISFCISIFIASLFGCSNTNSPTSSGNTPLGSDGSITGIVSLGTEINSSSPSQFASSAGVTVSLDGTTNSTTTDSSGFWKFSNIPSGNYDVTISKSGFGLTRIYGVPISGPGTAYIQRVDLGVLPSQAPQVVSANVATVVWTDSGKQKQRQELQIKWKTPLDRSYSGVHIFLDKDSTLQPEDVHFYSSLTSTNTGTLLSDEWLGWNGQPDFRDTILHATAREGVMACSIETLHAHGMTSGTTIYVSLAQHDPYPINGVAPNDNITYYDPVNNQNRIISPSPRSNVIAVTIP